MAIIIKTKRMILRPFEEEDADDIWPSVTPALTRYMLWDGPQNAEDFKKTWQNWPARQKEGDSCVFVGRMRDTGSLAGLFSAHNFTTPAPRLALFVCEAFQRQGYASEALRAIMAWARENYSPQYFSYLVAEQNLASRKLVESLGGKAVSTEHNPKFMLIVYHIPA